MSAPAKQNASPSTPAPQTYRVSWREAVDAVMRLRTDHRGRRYVNRFTTGKVVEHFVVTAAFLMLALTGFTQTYYDSPVGSRVLEFFGGIDALRQVHHVFAFILGITVIYHIFNYLNDVFVYRRKGRMWLTQADLSLLLKFGLARKPVRFDRYTLAEKVTYWVLAVCIFILGASGLVQAFPLLATRIFPGTIIPLAQIFHRADALLGVATVLVWHLYDVVLRKFNLSIFTGNMAIKQMEQDHPLELEYLEKAAAAANSPSWPVTIEIGHAEPEPAPAQAEEQTVPEEAPKDEEQPAVPEAEAPQASTQKNLIEEEI